MHRELQTVGGGTTTAVSRKIEHTPPRLVTLRAIHDRWFRVSVFRFQS